jgi:hypothetical protein
MISSRMNRLNRDLAFVGIILNIASGITNAICQSRPFVIMAAIGLGLCLWSFTYHNNQLKKEKNND